MMGGAKRNTAIFMMAALLASIISPTSQKGSSGGGRSGGFSSSSFSSYRSFSRPVNTFSPSRPATFGGYSYSRPGYGTTPILIGYAVGLQTSAAQNSLNANLDAYCSGVSIECYKTPCQNALAQCQATKNTTLNLMSCPDPTFTECYQTPDTVFQCLGKRRPSFGDEDVKGFCNVLGGSAGSHRLQLGLLGILALAAILLV